MLFTGLGWKEIPALPEFSEWTDFDSPKKILKGISVVSSCAPVYGTSSWPGWANNKLLQNFEAFKPAPPPPKKPAPEPMDLTSKRRIDLNE